jgi:hypothetical protein
MKKNAFRLIILTLVTLFFYSCSTTQKLPNGKQIDKRLIGVWQGSEKDKQTSGLEKEWTMERNSDGTFTLNFITIQDGESDEFIETGNWWVKGNTFFEFHDNSGATDKYKFTVLNKEQVEFKMINSNVEFDNPNYVFIDTKISDLDSEKIKRDGLTIETAIKVKSIAEEYEYVRNNCQNCQFLGQSLIQHKGKPYDVLKVKRADGKEVSYYFDISLFF